MSAPTGTAFGWDASNHDWPRGPMDLARAHTEGINLATHKASEGLSFRDPYLGGFLRRAVAAGVAVVGSYHAQHPGNAVPQAELWFDYVNATYPDWHAHPCWVWQIDAEPWSGEREPSPADVLAIGQRIQQLSGCRASQVLAYAPEWVYGDELLGLPYALWASNYADNAAGPFRATSPANDDPRWHPYSGQVPKVLQHSSRATIAGQAPCDANVVRAGTVHDLRALFVPPPTPTPVLTGLALERKEGML